MSYDYGLPQLDLPQLNLVNALPSLKRQDLKVSDTQRPQIQVLFTAILPGTNEDQDEKHVDFTLEVVANPVTAEAVKFLKVARSIEWLIRPQIV